MGTTNAEREEELVKHLREEAYNNKHCFTQYAVLGLAFTSAILAVVLKSKDNFPYVGLVGVPLVILLITIAKIGTHKYANANRLAGYELHLQRTARYPSSIIPGWHPAMRTMGWEEAMRAWRIVHGTVFNFLYVHGNLACALPKRSAFQAFGSWAKGVIFFWTVDRRRTLLIRLNGDPIPPQKEWWFETPSHLHGAMAYNPGGYLQTLLGLLMSTAAICLGIALAASWKLFELAPEKWGINWGAACLVVVLGFSWWTVARFYQAHSKRVLLDEGLLSINSCAVLWQVISCAHFWTLDKLAASTQEKFISYENYSQTLGRKAVRFCDSIDNIYAWYAEVPIEAMAAKRDSVLRDPADLSSSTGRLLSIFRRAVPA